jgi:hypothetical protein
MVGAHAKKMVKQVIVVHKINNIPWKPIWNGDM